MRKLLLFATLLLAPGISAQTTAPSSGHGWDRVKALAPGTHIRVHTRSHDRVDCHVHSVSVDTLSCGMSVVLQRSEIKSIKTAHRVRSTIVGVVAGYFGAGLLALLGVEHCNSVGCAATVAVVALVVFVGSPIVAFLTDFTGATIYKEP
jgi:hypothetical protein